MELSIVVVAYNMQRELPRTIFTLSPEYQNLGADTYEIIVVDNGSDRPVDAVALAKLAPNLRVIRLPPGNPSPAKAINAAMQDTNGACVGLFVDGARLLTPGVLRLALEAYRSDSSKVVGTLGFHLGPDVQMRSSQAGYDQMVEDRLLDSVAWQEDGYSLFEIAVLAGSSANGWFGNVAESNGVFMDRTLWDNLGGFDERFDTPGGGLANLDFWKRAVSASGDIAWILLGEGTFHQIHGGAATSGSAGDRKRMFDQYSELRGAPFEMPVYRAQYVGKIDQRLLRRFGHTAATNDRRAHSIDGRSFPVGIPAELLSTLQAGTMRGTYKDRKFLKNPFDQAIYLQLLQQLRPRTIIEIGTSEGGSALWFSDLCQALAIDCRIIAIDRQPPASVPPSVSFFRGDSEAPDQSFPHGQLASAPRPWLVIEDSAHTFSSVSAVLEYFHTRLASGDYLVVEDGVVADLPAPQYRRYEDGPNRAVRDFLLRYRDQYAIDEVLCDMYGPNVTYCPNGWLVRK